jgi:hypothetical protein
VHLVNSKAEGDLFAGRVAEDFPIGHRRERESWRNTAIEDRQSLIIDPGPRTVSGPNQTAGCTGGQFRGIQVPLGEIRTDAASRLLVLGGFGRSGTSRPTQPLTNYANNDLWYDDVSDGPVTATVTLKCGDKLEVAPAWVIVAPPDFAPEVTNIVTLYDVAVDTALRHWPGSVPDPRTKPSFTRDIAPIFRRLAATSAVQQGGRAAGGRASDFTDLDALSKADATQRAALLAAFRNPHLDPGSPDAERQATSQFLPALSGDDGDALLGKPGFWLTITRTQYDVLMQWVNGNFQNDWNTAPDPIRDISPEGLDRAALEPCAGGPFYPGIEAGWLLRNPAAYAAPFRLSPTILRPGDVTRRMACPWQADYYECRSNWWPAQRPDEVLTLPAYQQLRQLDELLAQDQEEVERARLKSERDYLWKERSSWARGLPSDDTAGRLAMVEQWPQHGFIVSADQDGESFSLKGEPALVETERGRYDGLSWPEYFHILTNIEHHPGFLPKAREIAERFFEKADFSADANYAFFEYTPEAFDRRLRKLYDEMALGIDEESRMDTGRILWPVVVRREGDKDITKEIEFEVEPFSDRAVKERILQKAPLNLIDGAWLQRIVSAGPIDEVHSSLFSIWNDEAGNGIVNQNHANVYDALLRSLNLFLPPVTSRKFLDLEFLADAFLQPVFELSVSLFPDEFFPELLGMTLYMEWEASPEMAPTVRHLRRRKIDPQYFALHMSIDNITAGHGFIIKEAIKLYLQQAHDEGGSERVAETWRRIWRGYVTWATAGGMGIQLLELCLLIDYKQIDVSYPMMLLPEHVLDPAALVKQLTDAACDPKQPTFAAAVLKAFKPEVEEALRHNGAAVPCQELLGALVAELNRIVQSGKSLYQKGLIPDPQLQQDTKALIEERPDGEQLVRLNRLLLRDGFERSIADIPKMPQQWFPDYRSHFRKRFVDLVARKASTAKPFHKHAAIGDRNLGELFSNPDELVTALEASSLINRQHPRDSRLLELVRFGGPMYKIFTEAEIDIILDWIESLDFKQPTQTSPQTGVTPQGWAARVLAFLRDRSPVAGTISKHAAPQLAGRPLKEWFSDPENLMRALAGSRDWVVPRDSAASRLFIEFARGEMAFLGVRQFRGSSIADMFRRWIDSGAELVQKPGEGKPPEPPGLQPPAAAAKPELTFPDAPRQDTASVEAIPASAQGTILDPLFAARRKLIGMGCVH